MSNEGCEIRTSCGEIEESDPRQDLDGSAAFTLFVACSERTWGRNLTNRLQGLVSYLDDSKCDCSTLLVVLLRRAFWRIRGGDGCIFFVSLLEGVAFCFAFSLCFT